MDTLDRDESFVRDVDALFLPYEKLVTILPKYHEHLNRLVEYVARVDESIGQRLYIVLKENVVMMSRAYRYSGELETLEEKMRIHEAAIEARLYKQYNEGYARKLTPTDIKAYMNGEPEHIAVKEMMLEIVWLKRQFKGYVETFKSLGFSLKSMTDLRINSLEYEMIG